MRVIVLAQYFPPETTPTGRRAQELAESLAKSGHVVTVITGQPNHPATLDWFFRRRLGEMEEFPEGYAVVRVPLFRSTDPRAWKRLATYVTFMLAAAWKGIRHARPDVIIAISPLPAGLAGLAVHWWHRAPLIFDLQDVWPDSARAVGAMNKGFLFRVLERAEGLLYRSCARVVVISRGFKEYLTALGISPDRVVVVPNGVDNARFSHARPDLRIKRTATVRDRFVVGYAGNLGLAQGLDTMLDAAHLLRGEPVFFLLIGEGVERERLEQRALAEGLQNVRFMRGVSRHRVVSLLATCDALLVMLRDDPLFQITIPSKVYEYMAAGKPVLCSVSGECAEVVREADCGLAVKPGDATALASAIRRFADDRTASRRMGESGARWVGEHCDLPMVMSAYRKVVESLTSVNDELTMREDVKREAPLFG